MKTEIGEYVVGAYLKLILECDVVDYNVRQRGGGLAGLGELDVIGLRFRDKTAFICEATTHITGMLIKTAAETVKKVKEKHARQIEYASSNLKDFPTIHYMLWSPRVNSREMLAGFRQIDGIEFVINNDYARKVEELRELAANMTGDTNNPFFRTLQILECLSKYDPTLDTLMQCDLDRFVADLRGDSKLRMRITRFSSKLNSNSTRYEHDYVLGLQVGQIEKVVKCLTLADRHVQSWGSVSAVPGLLEILRKRDYKRYTELLEWVFVINDGNNPWLATGLSRYGNCRSLAEYKAQIVTDHDKKQAGEADALQRKHDKQERVRIKAYKDIWNAIRRRDSAAIEALLDRGVSLDFMNDDGVTVRQKLAEI